MNFLQRFIKIKNISNPRFLLRSVLLFLGKSFRFFTFAIAVALVSYCVYIWYGSIYKAQWDDNQKQEYSKNKSQGVTFNKNGFSHNVAAVKFREDESQRDLGELKDIFNLDNNASYTNNQVSVFPIDSGIDSNSKAVDKPIVADIPIGEGTAF